MHFIDENNRLIIDNDNDNPPPINLVNEKELLAVKAMLEMAMLDLKHWHNAYHELMCKYCDLVATMEEKK